MEEALKEISGTSRAPSLGTPVPDCHAGLGITLLDPPPPADRPVVMPLPRSMFVSFHATSGIYESADDTTSVAKADCQKIPVPSLNSVPPTDVTLASAPGRSTASPCVEAVTGEFGLLLKSQSAGPLSPAGPSTVMPSALACCMSALRELMLVVSKSASQSP